MKELFIVGAGGFCGSVARHLTMKCLPALTVMGPLYLLIVNVSGSVLAGVVTTALPVSNPWRLFLIAGFLGALTTFSSFSISMGEQLRAHTLMAILAITLHIVLCIAGYFAGCAVGNLLQT